MKNDDAGKLLLVLREQRSRYAVPAISVEEILEMPAITPLPLQPDYLRGIFNYKGHAIPALSLQVLCDDGTGEGETVCVILRSDDTLMALTADAAESLVTDDGQRMKHDGDLLDGKFLKLDYVMPGDPAVLVIDLERFCRAIESDFDQGTTLSL